MNRLTNRNANLSNVILVCKGRRKTVKGHTAKYVAEARIAELKGGEGE